jgi:hypothetical protein
LSLAHVQATAPSTSITLPCSSETAFSVEPSNFLNPRVLRLVATAMPNANGLSMFRGFVSTPLSRLRMTLWLFAVTPTFFPAATSAQIIRAPV